MGKHAYLVMAHNQLDLLKVLIQCLDYEENDIYIHLDKKWKNIDYNEIYSAANKSKIVVIKERVNVKWGTYSQIACEMCLLENAVSEHYQYYHLMSGMDLPLKSQKEIHDFFDKKMEQNLFTLIRLKLIRKHITELQNIIFGFLNQVITLRKFFIIFL